MAEAPRLRVREIALYERPVHLRLPFRFGVVTLTECPQAFAEVTLECSDGGTAWGWAAELMAPKWFDKNLSLSNDDNFDQLRSVLRLARDAYLADASADTAFGHFARHHDAHQAACAARGFNPLLAVPARDPWIPYYGYGAGVVRLSLGDNTELGGKVTGGYVRWNFFTDLTVTVGTTEWVSRGVMKD